MVDTNVPLLKSCSAELFDCCFKKISAKSRPFARFFADFLWYSLESYFKKRFYVIPPPTLELHAQNILFDKIFRSSTYLHFGSGFMSPSLFDAKLQVFEKRLAFRLLFRAEVN